MPFTVCSGCEEQKRSKHDEFYSIGDISNPFLLTIYDGVITRRNKN